MLSFSLENEESPETLQYKEITLGLRMGSLVNWSKIMENAGHYLEEIEERLTENMFTNNSFVKLVEHASLYYSVLNQTPRATFYRQVMNDHMARVKGQELYETKFELPLENEEKEHLSQLI